MHTEEFLPGLVLPTGYHGVLRQRLGEMSSADTEVNCLIALARAEGMVEALEMLKALDSSRIERLYQLIIETATARLAALQHEGGA
ncbi:hypothetical protein [Pseudomonas mosselii]|uniref:hypothetical protein n=1 Tax=Pseudomonas mosselii TaxID=78327 RepID=UPI001BD36334|nr:hypothetical protein [Pseudomonas mosselii]MBS9759789.1 hypothetical protein [Pseudomonas mosselii]